MMKGTFGCLFYLLINTNKIYGYYPYKIDELLAVNYSYATV